MVTRPFIQITGKVYVFAQCATFNNVLTTTVVKFQNTAIIDIKLPDDHSLFDVTGHSSNTGRIRFWDELNLQIQMFEDDHDHLRPWVKKPEPKTSTAPDTQHQVWNQCSRHEYSEWD